MPEPARIPVGGKFVLDDGTVPSWFQGEITASREALIRAGEYRDLGPIRVGLADDGTVIRLDGGERVPLTLVRPVPGQEFHYRVWVRGDRMERVDGSFLVEDAMTEIDLPTALREAIPADELPEWLVVRDVVESARDEAVQAAGDAIDAVAGLDTAIQDAVDTKVPAAVDQKITEIDLPALVGDEISTLAGPAVQAEVDARVDPLVTQAEEAADSAVAARDGMVTGGTVSGDDLILSTVDGGSFVAGNVRGAPGAPGAPGALAGASSYILTGPGRPDAPATTGGIITGSEPVGAEYRSTDGANVGAWVWMKRPAGWIVTDGDTGWRAITAPDPAFSTRDLRIKRAGSTVLFSLGRGGEPSAPTNFRLITLTRGGGFTPDSNHSGFPLAEYSTLLYGHYAMPSATRKLSAYRDGSSAAIDYVGTWDTNVFGTLTYNTSDSWPSSLPGTPG